MNRDEADRCLKIGQDSLNHKDYEKVLFLKGKMLISSGTQILQKKLSTRKSRLNFTFD